MHWTNEQWLNDPKSICLLVYSAITTLVCVVLSAILIKDLKWARKRRRHAVVEIKPEDLQHLTRESIDNKYEIDSSPHKTRLPPVTPNIHNSLSEYDPITCASKLTAEPEHPPIVHHYEDMKSPKSENRQYDRIIDHVATALCTVYDGNSKNGYIYELFMKQLLNKIKANHSGLYESIQNGGVVPGHMYEEVQEAKQQLVNAKHDFEEDNCYAKYLPPENGKKYVEVKESNDFSRSRNVFGSTDHLKYLKERKRVKPENETPYLEAKRFSAKIDCPKELRKLCREQEVNTNGNEISTKPSAKQVELTVEHKVPSTKTSQSKRPAHGVISRSH